MIERSIKLICTLRIFLQCADFVKAGAEQGLTPSDVVLAADITFSCVADPQAAKDVSIRKAQISFFKDNLSYLRVFVVLSLSEMYIYHVKTFF